MTTRQRRALQIISEPDLQPDSDDWEMLNEVLDGTRAINTSHEGGKLDAMAQGMEEDLRKSKRSVPLTTLADL